MKHQKLCLALLLLSFTLLVCGCQSSVTEETTTAFSVKELQTYEGLIGASDEEVVAALGEGEIQDFSGSVEGAEEPYTIMWRRGYEGSPFAENGRTVVQYLLPSLEEYKSKMQALPREAALITMIAEVSPDGAESIMQALTEAYGHPTKNDDTKIIDKEHPFDPSQIYLWYWDRTSTLRDTFYYEPPANEGDNATITFSFSNPTII